MPWIYNVSFAIEVSDVRFLVTSADKAILHTGDVRADHLFIQSLRRHPALAPFVASLIPGPVKSGGGRRVLDRIYLDTSAMYVQHITCH